MSVLGGEAGWAGCSCPYCRLGHTRGLSTVPPVPSPSWCMAPWLVPRLPSLLISVLMDMNEMQGSGVRPGADPGTLPLSSKSSVLSASLLQVGRQGGLGTLGRHSQSHRVEEKRSSQTVQHTYPPCQGLGLVEKI